MKTAKVGDVATQIRGVTYNKADVIDVPRDGFLPVLRANNITDRGLTFDDLVFVRAGNIAPKQRIVRGDIVIAASSGSLSVVGKAAQATTDFDGSFGAFCKVVRPGHLVDASYLGHFFRTSAYRRLISSLAAGANINNLKSEHLDNLIIPLPPLPVQRRIAAILDQADALRRLRRDTLDRLADLGQAIFYEMFGDLIANDRQLPVATLDEFIRGFETGKNLAPDPDNESAANRVLKISAVTSGRFDPKEAKPLPNTYRPPASHFVRNGDLLFSRANTAALIGATAIVNDATDNLVLPDKLWRFQWHGRTEAVFTHHLFQSPPMRAEISRRASGTSGSMKNIGKGKVLSIRLGLPGPEQRQAFEQRIKRGQDVMDAARQALTQAEKLFASLQHRAFRGEL